MLKKKLQQKMNLHDSNELIYIIIDDKTASFLF